MMYSVINLSPKKTQRLSIANWNNFCPDQQTITHWPYIPPGNLSKTLHRTPSAINRKTKHGYTEKQHTGANRGWATSRKPTDPAKVWKANTLHFGKATESFDNIQENYQNSVKITQYYKDRYNNGKTEFRDYLQAIYSENSLRKNLIQQKYQIINYENYVYKAMAGKY